MAKPVITPGTKYVVLGASFQRVSLIKMDTDYNTMIAAKHWVATYGGQAMCYCVQNGQLGGRPFHTEFSTVSL